MSEARDIGRAAETHALAWLRRQGLTLLEANYRCRAGELDLIMLEGDILVFVEVRSRRNAAFGSAAESVTASKQRKLLTAARHYLQYHEQHAGKAQRFDVIAITNGDMEWIKNAFGTD